MSIHGCRIDAVQSAESTARVQSASLLSQLVGLVVAILAVILLIGQSAQAATVTELVEATPIPTFRIGTNNFPAAGVESMECHGVSECQGTIEAFAIDLYSNIEGQVTTATRPLGSQMINGQPYRTCIDVTLTNSENSTTNCLSVATFVAKCDRAGGFGAVGLNAAGSVRIFNPGINSSLPADVVTFACRKSIEVRVPDTTDDDLACSGGKRDKLAELQGSSRTVGNPIQAATGLKMQREVLFDDPRGVLDFDLTYLSRTTTGLGRGRFVHRFGTVAIDNSPGAVPPNGCVSGSYQFGPTPDGDARSESACFKRIWGGGTVNSSGSVAPFVSFETPDGQVVQFNPAQGNAPTESSVRDRLELNTDTAIPAKWKLIRNNKNTVEYYSAGAQLIRVDPITGGQLLLDYSAGEEPGFPQAGLLKQVTDHYGRTLKFIYDDLARLSTVENPAGQIYTLRYDESTSACDECNNLTSIEYPDGETKQFHYEIPDTQALLGSRLLTGITNENGVRVGTYAYDGLMRAFETTGPDNINKTILNFANYPNEVQIFDSRGALRTQSFSLRKGAYRLTGQGQPAGAGCAAATRAQQYDSNGNVSERTDFNGNRQTFTYDTQRNLPLTAVSAAGTAQAQTTTYEWHPDWQLMARMAEPERITTLVYNGQPDPTNNDTVLTCAPAEATVDAKPLAVLCARIEQATDDADGTQAFAAAVTSGNRIWRYTYNEYGQVRTLREPRTDLEVPRSIFSYRADTQENWTAGDLNFVENAVGHRTRFVEYDRNSRLIRSIDPNNVITKFWYAPRGWVTRVSVYPQGGGESLPTFYEYDAVGNRTYMRTPDSNITNYFYDKANRLVGLTDRLRNLRSYTYDTENNVLREEVRDPQNRLVELLTRSFDPLNRAESVTRYDADDPLVSEAATVQWDAGSGDDALGPNPAVIGQEVTFRALITGSGTEAPTGVVVLKRGTLPIGQATLSRVGDTNQALAIYRTRDLAIGTHAIRAVYLGDTSTASGSTPVLTQVITEKQTSATTLTIEPSLTVVVGQTVTYRASLTGVLIARLENGDLSPGWITFTRDGTVLGTVEVSPLESDPATFGAEFSESNVPEGGPYAISVDYAGNESVLASVGTSDLTMAPKVQPTLSFVNPPTAIKTSGAPVTTDTPLRLWVRLTGALPVNNEYGEIELFANGSSIGVYPVASADGVLDVDVQLVPNLPLGEQTFSATYSGNASSLVNTVTANSTITIEEKLTATITVQSALSFEGQQISSPLPTELIVGQFVSGAYEISDFFYDFGSIQDEFGNFFQQAGELVTYLNGTEVDRVRFEPYNLVDYSAPGNSRDTVRARILIPQYFPVGQHSLEVKYTGNHAMMAVDVYNGVLTITPKVTSEFVDVPPYYLTNGTGFAALAYIDGLVEVRPPNFSVDPPIEFGTVDLFVDGQPIAISGSGNEVMSARREPTGNSWPYPHRARPTTLLALAPGKYELQLDYLGNLSTEGTSLTRPLYSYPITTVMHADSVTTTGSEFDAIVYFEDIITANGSVDVKIDGVSVATAVVEQEPTPGVWPYPYRAITSIATPANQGTYQLIFDFSGTFLSTPGSTLIASAASTTVTLTVPDPATQTVMHASNYGYTGGPFDALVYIESLVSTAGTVDIKIDGTSVGTATIEQEPTPGAWPYPFRATSNVNGPTVAGTYSLTFEFSGSATDSPASKTVTLEVAIL